MRSIQLPLMAAFIAVMTGCQGTGELTAGGQTNSAGSAAMTLRIVASGEPDLHFYGMCDASGAVPIDLSRFVVADDEDNLLRFYSVERGGQAFLQYDVSPAMGLVPGKAKPNRPVKPVEEMDIEAATQVGPYAYWLTSHGRNKSGKHKPARFHFFATTLTTNHSEFGVVGDAYIDLVSALSADPRFASFKLAEASQLPPKAEGGLNIEGMTAGPDGGVWIGLRNPTFAGKALVFSLNNPQAVITGQAPEFGDPILLDLHGSGVRALSSWRGYYLVVGGAANSDGESALYVWDPHTEQVSQQLSFRPTEFNPEAFFTPDESSSMLLLSDDGNLEINGLVCKDLTEQNLKTYRGRWLQFNLQPI